MSREILMFLFIVVTGSVIVLYDFLVILGLIIVFVRSKRTRTDSRVHSGSPARSTFSSSSHDDSDDHYSYEDESRRGLAQLREDEWRESEERERQEAETVARERYEERERYRQEESNDYYAQKEQERIDRLYEKRDEWLRARYGGSDDE